VEELTDPATGTIKHVSSPFLFLVYLALMLYLQIAKETGKEVVWTEEDNYKFKLSLFRLALKKWIKSSSREFLLEVSSRNLKCLVIAIVPRKRQEEVLTYLSDEASMQDLSVSRPRSRVEWGIPVPGDPSHTIYVWLDALTSYMTAVGYPWESDSEMKLSGWPADVHVVGKDILR
jgi:methionyl-tRNA synthetase